MRPACALLLLCGCALTAKQAPVEFRYFSPATTAPQQDKKEAAAEAPLRLGRVTSSANLRTRIVYRHSAIEVGEYFPLRWTENPEAYLRRALQRALFDDGSFAQGFSQTLPTLEVELLAFEEVRTPGKHAGRVQLRYQLNGDAEVLAAGVITEERDAAPGLEPAVVAIGAALDQATGALSRIVAERLNPPATGQAVK